MQTYTFWRGTRNALLLKIETDAGIHGWGEGSMEWMEDVVAAAIHNYQELLIDCNPLDNLSLVDDLTRRFPWKGGPILGSALSAIDIALWDIVGKARGAPVYELLGGARRRKMWALRQLHLPRRGRGRPAGAALDGAGADGDEGQSRRAATLAVGPAGD